jgi:hypothetical protein
MTHRIKLDIAQDEFDFVKEAIAYKAKSLIDYLDRCKEESEINDIEINNFNNMLREMIQTPIPTKRRVGRPKGSKNAK